MRAIDKNNKRMGMYPQMRDGKDLGIVFLGAARAIVLLCTMLLFSSQASALPSYARQTGYACIKCHVGGFGPQLTPYGVKFKIAAYTETDHKGLKIPIAMFAYGGLTHTGLDNASYYYNQTYGFTIGRFSKHGQPDPVLYSFSANSSPDTVGTVFQADYTPFGKEDSWGRPFANARVGLQYTVYTKYDGASTNYDGTGRNASDNNTLYLFVWLAM